MNPEDAIDLTRGALMTALMIGAPILLVGVVMGLLIGLLQALTQIQDQTISFVPKIVAMIVAVAFCLPWLVQRMMEYSEDIILDIPRIVMGG
jgi:flagellar biosynthetic protein FliQ